MVQWKLNFSGDVFESFELFSILIELLIALDFLQADVSKYVGLLGLIDNSTLNLNKTIFGLVSKYNSILLFKLYLRIVLYNFFSLLHKIDNLVRYPTVR